MIPSATKVRGGQMIQHIFRGYNVMIVVSNMDSNDDLLVILVGSHIIYIRYICTYTTYDSTSAAKIILYLLQTKV